MRGSINDLPDFGPVPQPRFPCIDETPPLRTNAVIADAVEKAIQGISLARRLTIKRIEVKPEYGVDGDLLTADVRVGFGMIFARREE